MISYLLDTNHLSAMMDGKPIITQRVTQMAGQADFGISIPSVGELWFMVFNSANRQKNTERLDAALRDLTRWSFDESVAREFGQIKTELRRMGRPTPDTDSQIAAVARFNKLVVLTADAHFGSILSLKTENWLK